MDCAMKCRHALKAFLRATANPSSSPEERSRRMLVWFAFLPEADRAELFSRFPDPASYAQVFAQLDERGLADDFAAQLEGRPPSERLRVEVAADGTLVIDFLEDDDESRAA